jgi:hypothetical protein
MPTSTVESASGEVEIRALWARAGEEDAIRNSAEVAKNSLNLEVFFMH